DYKVDEAQVFQTMFEHGNQEKIRVEGFSMLDMKRYLDHLGFRADGIEASLDQLASAGVPAIALIQENGYAHFVVIKGLRADKVLLGDPAMGTRVMPRSRFEQIWINSILLVARNRVDIARFNEESDWRILPRAPLARGLDRNMVDVQLLQRGTWDY
ncbi:MAG: peptidase C39, partial [Betaproteobacteria bacterium HGW-Betaproteobacteria-19]